MMSHRLFVKHPCAALHQQQQQQQQKLQTTLTLQKKKTIFTWTEVRLSQLRTLATNWPIVAAPDDDDECGAVSRMRIGRGIRSTRRKPVPVPLCPPQIPHDLTWDSTRASAAGSRRLTA
jgi:hypothetical protein